MAITLEPRRGEATRVISSLTDFVNVTKDEKVVRDIAEIRRLQTVGAQKKAIGKDAESADAFRQADKIKSALPGFIFQCREFEVHNWTDKKGTDHGNAAWRHQKYGRLNGLFMLDYDHIDDPRQLWIDIQRKGLLKRWKVLLAFITSSAKGLKIVAVADENVGNLSQNQVAFSDIVGVRCDEKCKDASRLSFTPGYDDILYLNELLCTAENQAFIEKWEGKYNDGSADQEIWGLPPTPSKGRGAEKVRPAADGEAEFVEMCRGMAEVIAGGGELEADEAAENRTYRGVKIKDFISQYIGGEQPGVGERHDTLLHLACDLRYVLDNDIKAIAYYLFRQPFVQDLVKEGRDVAKTIQEGYGYQYFKNKPKKVREVLEFLSSSVKAASGKDKEAEVREAMTAFGEQIAGLFNTYPCLKEVCGSVATASYAAMLFAGGALFGTLATRTWYYFYHNPDAMRRLNYAIFIIADPASGKSTIGDLYKKILAPILAKDEIYENAINDYKRASKQHDLLKKKDKDSTEVTYPVSKTRIHGPRTANNIFIEDMVNNYEEIDGQRLYLHLFTFSSELDSAMAASKGGQWIDKNIFELLAFHNEQDDQHYRNIDAYTGKFNVYWNYIYTGTPFSLHKKVNQRNFGSGLYSRLAVMPLLADSFYMMPRMRRTKQLEKQNDTLNEWACRMDGVKGYLPIDRLVDVAYDWVKDRVDYARSVDNKALKNLALRVPYYGINVAVPFIIMRHWKEWNESHTLPLDETDDDFVRLIMDIQYYTQKLYFGNYAEEYFKERETDYSETALTSESDELKLLLAKLPGKFTRNEAENLLKLSRVTTNRILLKMFNESMINREGKANSPKAFYTKLDYGKEK